LESRQETIEVQRTIGEGYNESTSKKRKRDNESASKTKHSKTMHLKKILPIDKQETSRPRMNEDVNNKSNKKWNTPLEPRQRKRMNPSIKHFFHVNHE
jgi:hypothetical protein